ncbi:CAMK family protein kinase [Trichomonas vaginalis G3]|uniref:CAMK family protein kinase n=1 Tax=Trichomonas vaginalis (strain ATCC PRA-98 / G3) TaxID=412133 RepID=A2EUD9_TRIV3|nr:protein kinase protein [Trichomonas vaginalis G3]EAY03763.1 CAMK family protein kinase [Trichomonas vaginalis G3]KAI5532719.1 protein kinase protein [Trichomonas vaginalis G3]|eukprot:XP_001315986.1 CAMK family protein kinase [Trichomonas vaginalis G3]
MEYCPSSIDKIFLERWVLTNEELYRYAIGMAQSLQSCHEFGIRHGDVKPSNFLIDKYGRVKICDFGFSQKLNRDENNTNFSGTFIYESPEIIRQEPFDGFAADIWALGVSYFILITGQCPWNLYSKDAMIKSIQNAIFDEFQINDLLLRRIVSLCLQIDPTKRPSAEDLVNMLREKIETGRKKLIRPISSAMFTTPLMKSKTHTRIRHVSSF